MPVAQYPTPTVVAPDVNEIGPWIAVFQDLPIEYRGATVKEFKDGGASYGLANANGVLRFLIGYQGLFPVEVAILDAHYNSANGLFGGFNFRHPRTNVLYTDVHYESYEYPQHSKIYMQERNVILIKRPTG